MSTEPVRAGARDIAVPAYVHPSVRPDLWQRMAEHAELLRFVVVNPHNGVGEAVDPAYLSAVGPLHAAGVRTVGYVDTAYGQRAPAEVVAEAVAYRERYGITGVFLDQASSDLAGVSTYERYLLGLRGSGVRFVVLNPGVHPHPAYCDLVNVTVTFEGDWGAYRDLEEPAWVRARAASRFAHLVYDVPGWVARNPQWAVRHHHARTACLSRGSLPNPWDRLPAGLGRRSAGTVRAVS